MKIKNKIKQLNAEVTINVQSQYPSLMKFIRTKRQLSEDLLANNLNISLDEYLDYESGKKIVSTELFYRVCNILDWKYKTFQSS